MTTDEKLLYYYGISQPEARHYWLAEKYVNVLKDKIDKCKKLQGKLLQEPLLKRDSKRITDIGNHIVELNVLIKEVK